MQAAGLAIEQAEVVQVGGHLRDEAAGPVRRGLVRDIRIDRRPARSGADAACER